MIAWNRNSCSKFPRAKEKHDELVARLDDFRFGEKIKLTVMRQGENREVQTILQGGE